MTAGRCTLNDVFGISEQVTASYVDRGGLDRRLKYLLGTDRHIVIHGDSKQGKSWLRRRLLEKQRTLQVQCVSRSTPQSLVEQALGMAGVRAEIKLTKTNDLAGQLEFEGTAEGRAVFAKILGRAKVGGTKSQKESVEEAGYGQHPANLEWVARVLKADGRRVVIEDFHYLAEEHRAVIADWMKALGGYELFVIVVGVWAQTNFLTYYNGELDGRVEDIELRWTDDELDDVLLTGCRALNVEMTRDLRVRLVSACYGNVGLMQRLAEQVCLAEGVERSQPHLQRVSHANSYDAATTYVAHGMHDRFRGFVSGFVQGGGASKGKAVYMHLLRAIMEFDDHELLEGVSRQDLAARIESNSPGVIGAADLSGALKRIERLQETIKVRPLVLTYSPDARRIYLADRGLLFYRRFGEPSWPWDQSDGGRLFD